MYRGGRRFQVGDIRAAVAKFITGQASGSFELYRAYEGVARIVGYDERHHGRSPADYDAEKRFEGQVYREITRITDNGGLVKTGHDRQIVYYTPAAYQAKQVKDAEDAAGVAARQARWARIHDELAAWGLENTNSSFANESGRGRPVRLDLEDFEALMTRARGTTPAG